MTGFTVAAVGDRRHSVIRTIAGGHIPKLEP